MRHAVLLLAAVLVALPARAQDADRSVKGGGITATGWKGRVDRAPLSKGKTINDSKFAPMDGGYRLSIGPAAYFWNDANKASGDYSVKATFKEFKMTSSHPHSYGIFIGGNGLESDNETLMYCIVYGNGTYSVKTFHGSNVTTVVDRATNPALHKADDKGESTNEIGWSVKGGKASCVINGTTVKTLDKGEVVAPDKLTSFDGIYGIRVSHNLELSVTGLTKGK